MEGLIILWIGCGIAAAIVASKKGNSGCGGFALGILLGPIGLIIALVSAPNRESMDSKSIADGDGKKCPFCAELIKVDAIKCRFCGSDVEGSDE